MLCEGSVRRIRKPRITPLHAVKTFFIPLFVAWITTATLIAQDVAETDLREETDPQAEIVSEIEGPKNPVTEIPTSNQNPEQLAVENSATVSETKRDVLFEKIEALQKKFVNDRQDYTTRAISRLGAALEDDEAAFSLYMECVRELDFDSKGLPAINFIEWRKKNIKGLRSREHKQALRLQLLHTMAALRAGFATDIRDAFPAANRWIQHYVEVEGSLSNPRKFSQEQDQFRDADEEVDLTNRQFRLLLEGGVYGSVFGRYFDLKRVVKIPSGWPTSPMDVDGFFSKVLLPICREQGDWPGINRAWGVRLSALRSVARDREKRDLKEEWDAIMKKVYPELLWERAVDKIAFGPDPEIGLKEAYSVIATYFGHSEMPRWIQQYTLMVRPPEPEEGSGVNNETLASLLSSLRPPEPPKMLKEDEKAAKEDGKAPTIEDPEE